MTAFASEHSRSIDSVVAENVNLRMCAAQSVQAARIDADLSVIAIAHPQAANLSGSAAGGIISANTTMNESTAILVGGGSVKLENCIAQWVVGGAVEARNVFALAVVAGSVNGRVKAIMGTRSAIAFGLALGCSSLIVALVRRWL